MDELWKDITLTNSLHNEIPATPPLSLQHLTRASQHSSAATSSSFNGVILQDFLNGPLIKDGPPPRPPPPPPPIDLNLDSACSLGPTPHLGFSPNMKRSVLEQRQMMMNGGDGFCIGYDGSGDDRRQKRMIKNRESAARSRARKQAYTNELELEVAHLVQENAKLRRQCEELSSAMAAQIPAKKTLQRTSSSPF